MNMVNRLIRTTLKIAMPQLNRLLLAVALLCIVGNLSSFAAEDYSPTAYVTVAWDANAPEDNVTGYYVYVGLASRNYYRKDDAGNNTKYTVTTLNELSEYFIAVTAYRVDDTQEPPVIYESDYSEEISVTFVPIKPDPIYGGNVVYVRLSPPDPDPVVDSDPVVDPEPVTDGTTYRFCLNCN